MCRFFGSDIFSFLQMNTAVEMTRISLEAARHARYGFVHVIMFNNKSTAYPVTTLAQEQSLLNNDMRAGTPRPRLFCFSHFSVDVCLLGGGTSFKACLTDLANVLVGVKNTNATVRTRFFFQYCLRERAGDFPD